MKTLPDIPELRSALSLAGIVCTAVIVLSIGWQLAKPRIDAARHALLLVSVQEVLDGVVHDNDPVNDRITVHAAGSPTGKKIAIYRARRGGSPVALITETLAPDGYSGPIQLLIGSHRSGRILGVRVTAHRETPGLGDAIEVQRNDWIRQLDGLSTVALDSPDWQLRADGGNVDHISGATITSKAVLAGVRRTMAWQGQRENALFSAPADTTIQP